MQSLIFLWIQLRMTQQYLREEFFDPLESPANSADPNKPTGPVTLPRDSVKQVRTFSSAMRPRVGSSPRQKLFRLLGSRSSKLANSESRNRRNIVRS
jgi:hypothetical protein